jgi:hypothetical protein
LSSPLPRPVGPLLAAAREEAALARHGYVGVEHLLVALAAAPTGSVARLLGEQGVTAVRVREAARRVVGDGRGDGPRWDSAALLATLGVDLDEIRRQVDARFGPDALARLYTGPVGWNLRPRGPLCGPHFSPQLKQAVDSALGRCWDAAPPHLHERLLLGALDADSPGLAALFGELDVSATPLRAQAALAVKAAS